MIFRILKSPLCVRACRKEPDRCISVEIAPLTSQEKTDETLTRSSRAAACRCFGPIHRRLYFVARQNRGAPRRKTALPPSNPQRAGGSGSLALNTANGA